jgi:hypothetical protein
MRGAPKNLALLVRRELASILRENSVDVRSVIASSSDADIIQTVDGESVWVSASEAGLATSADLDDAIVGPSGAARFVSIVKWGVD